ncbi:MAG: chloride channel protein [Opitutaceae bacterium]|nr:chloride channel protein [Opitutaceae bacterium]
MLADLPARVFQGLPRRTRTVIATVVFGLAAGGAAVAFHLAIAAVYEAGIVRLAREASPAWFAVGSLLIVGGTSALSGWLLTRFCPAAAGSGIPQLKLAFWKDFGVVPWRVVWVKFVGGVLSVGGGASLGREGPSVQLGGGLASNVAGALGVAKNERRAAAAAGAAAGLAAAFNTPIAAVTFVLEEIIADLNSRLLGGVLIASVLGALVAHAVLGEHPSFRLADPGAPGWLVYVGAPVVAALAALVGVLFQRWALGVRGWNRRPRRLPAWVRVTLGGVAVWAIGNAVFLTTGHLGVFSLGYADLSAALNGELLWQMAALLLAAKLVATVVCYGLGGCGGIFAPTLFFGGMTGAAIGGLAALVLPLGHADQVTLAVVGMCACLGAVVRAPVTGILIVFEMTHEFSLVPSLMLGAIVSQAISRALTRENFYDALLAQDGNHIERVMPVRSLRSWMETPVSRVATARPVVLTDLSPAVLREALAQHRYERFPVVLDGRVAGVVSRIEAEDALSDGRPPRLDPACVCALETPVRDVERRLIESAGHLAVIVDPGAVAGADVNSAPIVGLLTLHDLLRAEILHARETETE